MKINFLLLFIAASTLFVACDPKDEEVLVTVPVITKGAYVLNQGSWHKNNSSLSYYNFADSTVTADVFSAANGRGLGDGGQDALIYGSNLYITVTESSMLWVLDPMTGKARKSISVVNDAQAPRSPRSIAAYGGKIYITLFDGNLAQLDTTSLTIEKVLPIGASPEGIVSANNLLYIAISGGYGAKDSTVLVVDPVSFKALRKITVALNPQKVVADSQGDIYVQSNGDYDAIRPKLQRIAKADEKVSTITSYEPVIMTMSNDNLYFLSFGTDYVTQTATNKKFIKYDALSEQTVSESFVSNDQMTKIPYCIDVDPTNGDVYIAQTDYTNYGKMYVFKKDGTSKTTFNVGVNAFKTVFITK